MSVSAVSKRDEKRNGKGAGKRKSAAGGATATATAPVATVAPVAHPIDIVTEAWERTNNVAPLQGPPHPPSPAVVGSSTLCVATLDLAMNQLYYSNIGDSGLLVLRHIDTEVAGYMR